jgi:hypothetical protein
MVGLAKARLAPFGNRCEIRLSDGDFDFTRYPTPFDRIVTTYVLDLLSPLEIKACLAAAHAVLAEGGLLCHAGLTFGTGPVSRATSSVWTWIHGMRPLLVGGCRPLALADHVPASHWHVIHREVVVRATIASEIVIVQTRGTDRVA